MYGSKIITNKCNLACFHCMCGENNNKVKSDDVYEKIFDNFKVTHLLNICGSEFILSLTQKKGYEY